ncbi:ATP-binding protein [Carbonactinospora thermoautotrophica]|uniref:ATP-binding protein n=1 Tax=Carbonactinospora thermoautotrophica TaxID=1469144 RepID=UPI0008320607|nr:ATP-binding protein [Carbonactinospora thermoautotrophica]
MQPTVAYPPREDAAGLMRRHVASFLTWRGLHHRFPTQDAQLVATELFTNAVRHARHHGHPITVVLGPREDALRIEVHDPDPTPPVPRLNPDPEATSGHGLLLVASLARRWGTTPTPDGGKTVFAEIPPLP